MVLQVAADLGDPAPDLTANEILGNIAAMRWAVDSVAAADEITVEHLSEVHRRLLAGTRLESQGGVVRDQQNWIGGSAFNTCRAAFVPPPPDRVDGLLQDLCAFCNDDALPAVAQAAIAHIHTVADITEDPQYAALGTLLRLPDDELGDVLLQNVTARLSDTPGEVRWPGPALGRHTDEVLAEAGLTDEQVAFLREKGVVR